MPSAFPHAHIWGKQSAPQPSSALNCLSFLYCTRPGTTVVANCIPEFAYSSKKFENDQHFSSFPLTYLYKNCLNINNSNNSGHCNAHPACTRFAMHAQKAIIHPDHKSKVCNETYSRSRYSAAALYRFCRQFRANAANAGLHRRSAGLLSRHGADTSI